MVLLGSDLTDLPVETQRFAEYICALGLTRTQVHGLFVFLGLHVGTPRTEIEMLDIIKTAEIVVPHDRAINLDDVVGDFYSGYEPILNEFYFRSGVTLELREIRAFDEMIPVRILSAKDNGLLDSSISIINTLSDSSRIMWSLIEALGQNTASMRRSLLDAYLSGVFQMQILGVCDSKGARQLHSVLTSFTPLFLGAIFTSLSTNSFERVYGILPLQVPLERLMSGISEEYGRQMWGFQSHIFFDDKNPIENLEGTSVEDWHLWVLNRAKAFADAYPEQLLPFSRSGVSLSPIPVWRAAIEDQKSVDAFIFDIWGYKSVDLRNFVEIMEYKACLVHVVYSSLTQSRETKH